MEDILLIEIDSLFDDSWINYILLKQILLKTQPDDFFSINLFFDIELFHYIFFDLLWKKMKRLI